MNAHRLVTAALDLRRSSPEDVDVLHPIWTDPRVRRFLFDDREISREEARAFLERSEESFRRNGYGLWLFFEKGAESLAGFAGLLQSSEREPSLVFGTRPDLRGRGYASEAASAVLAHAFDSLRLPRVLADVDEPNKASIRVLEKLGMRRTRRAIVNERPLLYYEMRVQWLP